MLGEIDFKAWQCLCEIIDNSIDAYVGSDSFERPTIKVILPARNVNELKPSQYLEIKDDGEGMTFEALSRSLKAGFSSNNPVDKMGLFGMGFNISTARLGHRTEVITSTKESKEFLKVTIDFQELEKEGHFLAPVERVPKKADEMGKHGTSIRITKLRTDNLRALYQRKKITQKLGKIYGRILREKSIDLIYHGQKCKPFKHCIWSAERSGQSKSGPVPAVINIDHILDEKKYCSICWVWLDNYESHCPSCGENTGILSRERRIKGWLGIQRYFAKEHYGIDFIRNGRVITELDKSLFFWQNQEQELELEYPIDGHGALGRIVGELEIDFVKVSHQKDSFQKDTQDWRDVVLHIRGDAPIRPNIGKNLGYPPNTTPVAELFSAFRKAKAGIKNLVPQRPNGSAMISDEEIKDYVRRFESGESDYQSDEKWWDLVNRASVQPQPTSQDGVTGGDPFAPKPPPAKNENYPVPLVSIGAVKEVKTVPDPLLAKMYSIDLFDNIAIRVVAEKALEGDHENGFSVSLKGVVLVFRYWPNSTAFEKNLLRPEDFLINELAYHLHSTAQNEVSKIPITAVELALREKYFSELYPTVEELHRQVEVFNSELITQLRSEITQGDFNYHDIPPTDLAGIKKRMAQNEVLDDLQMTEALEKCEFLSYAPFNIIRDITCSNPQLVFGRGFFKIEWSDPADESSVMHTYLRDLRSFLGDIDWFLMNRSSLKNTLWRAKAKRLASALEILNDWRA